MEDPAIQIGLPCVYPQLCMWIGFVLAVVFIAMIAGIIYSVLREKKRQRLNHQLRRKRRKQPTDKKDIRKSN